MKLKNFLIEIIARGVEKGLNNFVGDGSSNLYNSIRIQRESAMKSSAEYAEKYMKNSVMFFSPVYELNRRRLMEYAISKITVDDGYYMEFGVFSGNSINHISSLIPNKTFYGFDSFEGLPEDWSGWTTPKGFFKCNDLPKVNSNVQLVKGWFNESLPKWKEQNSKKSIALLHIDCDLYNSTKTIFNELASYITSGTVIVFDEYFNYPNWETHEYKAFMEFVKEYKFGYEYIGHAFYQVVVVMK